MASAAGLRASDSNGLGAHGQWSCAGDFFSGFFLPFVGSGNVSNLMAGVAELSRMQLDPGTC